MRTPQVAPHVQAPGTTRPATTLLIGVVLLATAAAWLPGAEAHTGLSGETTPFAMPGWVVHIAGALVVALSFALIGAFLSREQQQHRLHAAAAHPAPATPAPGRTGPTPMRLLSLAVLLLMVAAAFTPGANAFPVVVLWIGVWVILPIIAYTLGDPWPRISPFAALAPLAARLRAGKDPLPYPRRLGMWPAVLLLLALIALEVGGAGGSDPGQQAAMLAVAYLALTLTGMSVFGNAWLQQAEVIGRMLQWWGAVSPLQYHDNRIGWRGLRGIRALPARRLDAVAFTLAILYGVNHDVLLHTRLGSLALDRLQAAAAPAPSLLLLLAGYLVFFLAWMTAARFMHDHAERLDGVGDTAAAFAASLLPIAAAYHLAHNIPYLFQNLGVAWAAIIDPLGLGWSLAGSAAAHAIPIPRGLLGPLSATQILLVILGHLVAVMAAHSMAFTQHPSRVQAMRAEVPLTVAMVLYTGIGLALLGAQGGGVS